MPLCSNTYRRGAIYWWRARFAGGAAASSTIALSLRVYDPVRARLLGLRLSAEADRLRRCMEAGTVEFEDIKMALSQALHANFATNMTWTLSDEAENALAAFKRVRVPPPPPPPWMPLPDDVSGKWPSRAQIEAVVSSITAADEINLRDAAECSRLDVGFDEDGFLLGIDNEPRAPEVMAAVYRFIAYGGAKARLTAKDEVKLAKEGRTCADIEAIRFLVRVVALTERKTSWRLGPSCDELVAALLKAHIQPAYKIVHAVRRQVLLSRASLLQVLASNTDQVDDHVFAIAAPPPVAAAPPVAALTPKIADASASAEHEEAAAAATRASAARNGAQNPGPTIDFLTLTEDFLTKKKRGKNRKSDRQYRALARLFVKIAGTSEPSKMGQAHIGKLFDLLPQLPKSYGKSPADEKRSLDDIIARGEAAVLQSGRPREELIGYEPPTVDRYVTQLGALLRYVKGRGFVIGDLDTLSDMRETDDEPDEDKRRPFSEAEEQTLFSSAPWTGCASDENRREPGSLVVHDSLYWIPLLAKYGFATLSEAALLMLHDIDDKAGIPAIELRPNELRNKLKTPVRRRRQPIHPELIRLGFLDYVRLLRSLGFKILFPDLRLRGEATPMTNLFNKSWVPVLDLALPTARTEKKTLHSFRKTGNTVLAAMPSEVAPEVRFQLMGHSQKSINGKNYIAPFPDDVKLKAIQRLPNTTSFLVRAELRLNRMVLAAAEHLDRGSYGLI